jgi:phenylacetate-CoA ligase
MSMAAKWIYKIGEAKYNNRIAHHAQELEKTDFADLHTLQDLQLERLKRLLRHAKQHSPRYRDKLQEIDIKNFNIETLTSLPILTKEELREHTSEFLNNPNDDKIFTASTSGSTGEAMLFYKNTDWDAAARAAQLRAYDWYGIKPWMKNLYFWGFNTSWKKLLFVRGTDFLMNRKRIFSYDEKTISGHEAYLRNCAYIDGYSSAIFTLAQYFDKNGIHFSNIKMVKGTSEKIYESYQPVIERVFGKRMISEYGAAETGIIAFECPKGNMHIAMENVIVEEVDKRILVTNLFSYSLPIIRYDLGDYIELDTQSSCSCGRSHYILKEVTGRIGHKIRGARGTYPALYLYYVFKNISLGYQLNLGYFAKQEEIGHLKLNVMYDDINYMLVKDYIAEEMTKLFGDDITWSIEFVKKVDHKGKKTQAFESTL